MNSNEIYMKMAELWTELSLEHSKPSKAAPSIVTGKLGFE